MKKLILSLCAVCFAFSLSTMVFAADDKPEKKERDFDAIFKKMDKNSDSKLSLEEFTGKRTGEKADKAKAFFAKKDKNKDGSLSLEEFKAKGKKKPKKDE